MRTSLVTSDRQKLTANSLEAIHRLYRRLQRCSFFKIPRQNKEWWKKRTVSETCSVVSMTNLGFGHGLTSSITTECGLLNFVNQITNFTFLEVIRRTNSCFMNLSAPNKQQNNITVVSLVMLKKKTIFIIR